MDSSCTVEESAALAKAAMEAIGFVLSCNDASEEGLLVIRRNVDLARQVCNQLAAHDDAAHAQDLLDAAQRGEAFLAQHGHAIQ